MPVLLDKTFKRKNIKNNKHLIINIYEYNKRYKN